MTLKDRLAGEWQRQDICAFQRVLLSLSIEDQEAVKEAIKNNIPDTVLVRALRAEGHKTSKDSVGAHVRGLCKCPKK